jgi:hypothetical protein
MERLLKWALPGLLLGNLALVGSGVLEAQTALLAGIIAEGLLLVVGGRQIWVAVRRYRQDRAAGLDLEAALEEGMAVFLPRPAARLAALEPRLWITLGRWLLRRPVGPGTFPYARRSLFGPMLGLVAFSAPVEIFAFELLIPWPLVRVLVLIASVYSVLWLAGLYAGLKMYPHRLTPDGLRFYHGLLASGALPYDQIASVEAVRHKAPGGKDGLQPVPAEGAAYLAAGGRTDVTLRLRAPTVIAGLLRPTPPVTTVHLAADDGPALAAALQARWVAAPTPAIPVARSA